MKIKLRKVMLLTLAIVMMAGMAVMAATYSDVKPTGKYGWAYDYIVELSDKGIIQGYPDGTYRPDDNVTYLETLELIKGLVKPTDSELKAAHEKYGKLIDELKTPAWAKDAVATALSRDIVSENELRTVARAGMLEAGTTKKIDRLSVSLYMARAMELAPKTNPTLIYKDKDTINGKDAEHIAALQDTKVLHPEGKDGYFAATDSIRRSEIAKMFKFAYDWTVKNPVGELTEVTGSLLHSFEAFGDRTLQVDTQKEVLSFRVDDRTEIYDQDNKKIQFTDLKALANSQVKVSYVKGSGINMAKEIRVTFSDVKVEKVYKFIERSATWANENTVTVRNLETNKNETLTLARNYTVKDENGKTTTISSLKDGDLLTLKLDDKLVTEINQYKVTVGKYEVVRAPYIASNNQEQIQLKDIKTGNTDTYILVKGVKLRKADRTPGVTSDIKVGDTVDITVAPINKSSIMALDIGLSVNNRGINNRVYKIVGIDDYEVRVDQGGSYDTFRLSSSIRLTSTEKRDLNGSYALLEINSSRTVTKIEKVNGNGIDALVYDVSDSRFNDTYTLEARAKSNYYEGVFPGKAPTELTKNTELLIFLDSNDTIIDYYIYR